MKAIICILFTTLSSLLIVGCFSSSKDDKTKINIPCHDCAGMEVSLSENNILPGGPEKVYQSRFDSSGRAEFEFTRNDSLNLFLVVGNRDHLEWKFFTTLYVEPAAAINLTIKEGRPAFEGDLKTINSYYTDINLIERERVKYANMNFKESATHLEKQVFLDSLMQFGAEIKNRIKGDKSISDYYRQMLIDYNALFEATQRMHFDTRFAYNAINNDISFVMDSTLSGAFKGLHLQPEFINNPTYVWNFANRLGPIFLDILNYRLDHGVKTGEYEHLKGAVEKDSQLDSYRELIMALFVGYMALDNKIDYDSQSEMTDFFRHDYPYSKYLEGLNHILKVYSEFRNGMPMKDLEMQDTNGNMFRLSDLNGNLVYIDIWATWCGSCVDELKYAAKLSKKYANRPDLKFLYLSIDDDADAWKRFLKKNSHIKGIHGLQNYGFLTLSNHVSPLYKITGIPRYMLIDKKGKIVTTKAKRPSELFSQNYLDSLLTL